MDTGPVAFGSVAEHMVGGTAHLMGEKQTRKEEEPRKSDTLGRVCFFRLVRDTKHKQHS